MMCMDAKSLEFGLQTEDTRHNFRHLILWSINFTESFSRTRSFAVRALDLIESPLFNFTVRNHTENVHFVSLWTWPNRMAQKLFSFQWKCHTIAVLTFRKNESLIGIMQYQVFGLKFLNSSALFTVVVTAVRCVATCASHL